jgi:CheY-like chemotaxis protein
VDDQEVLCEVLRALLRREGFHAETVGNGEAAMAQLRQCPFDVLLVDKNLPGMSGLDVLAHARALRSHLEVIIITGYASLDSALTALRHGAYDYLLKPFDDLAEVAAKVRQAADRARIVRDSQRVTQELRARNELLEQALQDVRQGRRGTLPPGTRLSTLTPVGATIPPGAIATPVSVTGTLPPGRVSRVTPPPQTIPPRGSAPATPRVSEEVWAPLRSLTRELKAMRQAVPLGSDTKALDTALSELGKLDRALERLSEGRSAEGTSPLGRA